MPHSSVRRAIKLCFFSLLAAGLATCGGDSGTGPDGGGDGGGGGGGGGGVASVTVSPSSASVEVGEQVQLNATARDASGGTVSGTVTWSVAPTSVASVSTSGLVTGLTAGEATVTATVQGVSGTAALEVQSAPLSGTAETVASVEEVIGDVLPPAGTPLEQRNLLDEVLAVADGIRALPGVDTVIVLESELSVETLMDSGVMHLFINSRPEGSESFGASPSAAPGPGESGTLTAAPVAPPVAAAPARVDGPPGSKRAVVTAFDGGAEMASKVRQMLANAGYDILSLGTSLDDYRNYKNLGVLHLDTHGVAYKRLTRNEDGSLDESDAFGLMSSTTAGSDLSAYRDELLDGSLVISTAQDQNGQVQTKFAITENFIARYWTFDQGVVLLHACYGGAGPMPASKNGGDIVDPSILRLTMLGAGARIVVAFDNLTWWSYAEPSVLYFFDRILGANQYEKEDPPLRPFDIQKVHQAMQEEGLLQFTRPSMSVLGIGFGGNEVNVVFDDVGDRATLAPSIRYMDVVDDVAEGTGKLTLQGLFGDEQGAVEVEGSSVSIDSWSNESIVARVPFEGTSSAGQVVVKRPDGVKSNETPLTEWRGTVTVTTEALGSLKATATMEIRFRADVHAFRDDITDDPRFREVPVYVNPASTGTSVGSGTYTAPSGATETWYGSYDMQMIPKAEVDQGVFPLTSSAMGGSVRLDPDAGTAELCLAVWGQVGIRVQTSQGTQESTGFAALIFPDLADRMKGLLGCFDADLDDDTFVIDSGDRSATNDDVKFRVKWTEFYPYSAPDDDTAG